MWRTYVRRGAVVHTYVTTRAKDRRGCASRACVTALRHQVGPTMSNARNLSGKTAFLIAARSVAGAAPGVKVVAGGWAVGQWK